MNRQIPGYHYDEEKKKYFKIQPNHAGPAGSAYSADQVKRRKVELETASEIARNVERKRKLVRRARILQDPLLGGSLSREHGHGHPSDGSARSYIEGWDSAEVLPSEASPSPDPRVRILSRLLSSQPGNLYTPARPEEYVHLNSSTVAMGAIEYDPVTRSLFYPMDGQTLCMAVERKHEPREDQAHEPLYLRRGTIHLSTNHTPITSITMDPKRRFMLTTWQGPTMGHNIHIVKLDGAEVDNGPFSGADLYFHGYHPSDLLNTSIISRMSGVTDIAPTIWSATHGAQGSPFVFVIASDDGAATVDENANLYALLPQPSAVLAVECLAQQPFVILAGTRNGYVRFFDIRDRIRDYYSDIESIKHPSAVSKIKQLSDHVIAVAGLNSTLCNYDLRFSKQRPRGKAWPDWHCAHAKGQDIERVEVSNPVVLYPEHHNSAHIELGFDVDVEAGIVAAAQHDPYRTISIFSLKTGQLLKSLHVKDTQALSSCDKADVKALKFVPDRGSGHMKSLWAAKGTRIVRFAW